MKKYIIVLLICCVNNWVMPIDNENFENDQEERKSEECNFGCSCKQYKKRRLIQKKHCEHQRCCQKRNRAITGGILGAGAGLGIGAAVGASMTPSAVGAGMAVGGPVGLVGGVVLSQIL